MPLEDVVRPFQQPAQNAAFKPPSTRGNNPDRATALIGDGSQPAADDTVVRTSKSNDMRWWPTFGAAHGSTADVVSVQPVDGSGTIDLSTSGVVRLTCTSANLTLTPGAMPSLPDEQASSIWAGVMRSVMVEVVITWAIAASARTFNVTGGRFASGEPPVMAADAGGVDVVLIQTFSDGLILVFHGGPDMKVLS